MMQINLLPWREQARTIKKRRLVCGTVLSSILAILAIVIFHIYLASVAREQNNLNEYLKNEVDVETSNIAANNSQEKKKQELESQLNDIINLYNQNNSVINFLNTIAGIVPAGISLNKVSLDSGNKVFISGYAENDSDVTNFLETMKKSPLFTDVVLNQITAGADVNSTRRNFEILAKQKEVKLG